MSDDPVHPTAPHGGCRSRGGCRTGHRPAAAAHAAARRAGPTRTPDPDVVALLGTLSRDAFLADLETLAAHPTRRSESAGFDEAATWAPDRARSRPATRSRPSRCRAAAAAAAT